MNQSKNLKVLIVDDEPHIVTAINFLMTKQGFLTERAFNGEVALDVVTAFQPNVIILDVMMPGLNGFEVAKKVRSNPANRNTQIVFLTAKGTTKDKLEGYSNGGDVYLTKPFDNDELVNIVSEIMEYG